MPSRLYFAAKLHKLAPEGSPVPGAIAPPTGAISLEMSGFGDEYALHLMSVVADELRTVKRHDILAPAQLL
jgi:hypothetical protein